VFEFHILTIGHFSRNLFWGEDQTKAYRDAVCTSTLIRGEKNKNIVVDPSRPAELMSEILFNRSGLRPDAVDCVFLTHAHGDHYVGIECFEKAAWYMGAAELEAMKNSGDPRDRELAKRIRPAEPGFAQGIEPILLPGHTSGTTGLIFDTREGRAVICGDAVMTRDYFNARAGHFNQTDKNKTAKSIELLAKSADIIVPGHDIYFLTGRRISN